MGRHKRKKNLKGFQRRLATFKESTDYEVKQGLLRHRPGSRNPRKVGR